MAGERFGTAFRAALVVTGAALLSGAGCFETGPTRPTEEVAWSHVAAGDFHTCALGDGGAAYCWGLNGQGQLGSGPGSSRGITGRPHPVQGGFRFRSLTAGRAHTCGLSEDGELFCWGQGGSGQLGVDPDSASGACGGALCISPAPVPASDSIRFTRVEGGAAHTCALSETGDAYCWGDNSFGQLGTGEAGPETGRADPARVPVGVPLVSVSAGERHSCAVDETGAVWCWGDNGRGQVGPLTGSTCGARTDSGGRETGGFPCSPAPTRVPSERSFEAVAAGGTHTCALDAGGSAWCWGSDATHQLGDEFGSPEECLSSETTPGVPCSREPVRAVTEASFTSLSAGGAHACGRTAGGDARCWGDNSLGQVGYCGVGQPLVPTRVCRVSGFRRVAAGGRHSCGVTASGEAWCWGANGEGQLGSGSTRFSYFGPVKVRAALAGG